MKKQQVFATLMAVCLFTTAVAGPVAASTTSESSDTFTPAALEVGGFFGVNTPDNVVTENESIEWFVWYEDGEYDALSSWANETEDREIVTRDTQSNRALIRSPADDIGVSTVDRLLDRGLAGEEYVNGIDVNIQFDSPDPIRSLDSENAWEKPPHSYLAFRSGGFTSTGVAYGSDANESTLADAQSSMGAEGVSGSGDGVKIGIIDSGVNVGEGELYGQNGKAPTRIRIGGAKNFITGENGSLPEYGVSQRTTDTDLNNGSFSNATVVGTGEDASLVYEDGANIQNRWSFDDGSGDTASDDINDTDIQLKGTTWTDGYAGGGIAMEDGAYASSNKTYFDDTDNFTISMVVIPKNTTEHNPLITQRDSYSTMDFNLFQHKDGTVKLTLGEKNADTILGYANVGLTKGDPQAVALRKSGDTYTLWKNGTQVASNSSVQSWNISDDLQFGSWDKGGDSLNGTADEGRVYPYALSDSQISSIHNDVTTDLANTSQYTGAAHNTGNAITGSANLSIYNGEATIKLQGYNSTAGWTTVKKKTVTSSGNHSLVTASTDYDDYRTRVEFQATAHNTTLTLHDETLDYRAAKGNFSAVADGSGHGSWVASAVAADAANDSFDGVAPNATLYVAKALSDDGSGSTQDIIEAVEWAEQNNVDILSMSLGSPAYSEALAEELKAYLDGNGTAVVVAVGNSRMTTRYISSPADVDGVISVAATNTTAPQNAASAYFSQVGPDNGATDLSSGETRGAMPDVAAPGMSVTARVLNDSTGALEQSTLSGTSMATPLVAGSLATVLEEHPELRNQTEEVRTRLQETASPMPQAGVTEVGHGMVNVSNLVSNTTTEQSQEDVRTDAAKGRDAANTAYSGNLDRFSWIVDPEEKALT